MATIPEALALAQQHHQAGRLQVAEQIYRQVLAVDPNQAEAVHLLGVLAHQTSQHETAVEYISRAIALAGHVAAYHNNLGEAYRSLRQIPEAVASYRRALELNPLLAEAHSNLGNIFKDQGQLAEAIACYRRSVELKPDFVQAHSRMGSALRSQGELTQAVASCRRALELAPDCVDAHSNLVYTLMFCAGFDARAIYEEHRRWNRQHAQPLAKFIEPHGNDRSPYRRLRIGYVSPDFRLHPVGQFILPLLESHDHAGFEIFCYSSLAVPDALTERCRAQADVWRDVTTLSDEQLAVAIRRDRIDILVDLTMHMANNRLLVFARKPAPVQVTYLAYCGTTGLDAIDYRLTDPYLDPPGPGQQGEGDSCYSERSLRLPETYWCYKPPAEIPQVGPLPALKAGQVTFACLNNFCKVTDPTLEAWTRILQALPESRLILHAHSGSHHDRVRDFLVRQGVAPDRVTFVGFQPTAEYFGQYQEIDVALDPFPYGGGTTTCDALFMGVPVVTLAGDTAVGRGGLSILSNLGLAELVARDIEHYQRIAIDLAQDLPRLSRLRAELRDRMHGSPLMDAPRFACNVEAAYRTIWNDWCTAGDRQSDRPDNAMALAFGHHQAGRLESAEQIYRQILDADPQNAEALHLLGTLAHQMGRHEVAVENIGRAIGLTGNVAAFHNNLGEAYRALRRCTEAVSCYRRAIELKPDYPEACNNLGNALKDRGQFADAVVCYRRALELKPDHASAHNNLGITFNEQGQVDDAIACYRRALELDPEFAEAHNNLGNALKDQGQFTESVASFRRAIELNPNYSRAHSNLVYTLMFCSGYDARTLYEEHLRWNRQHAQPLGKFIQPHDNERSRDRRLRIGYVSPDFRSHPVGRFILPLLESHDHARFEIFCYSSLAVPDALTERCRAQADVWRDVTTLSDEQLAVAIRRDRIDILVDLTMHMAGNRLLVFARKPAPVQVTYLAYCGTTGLDAIDYRLADPFLDPPDPGQQGEDDSCYSERSLRLPETYWCYMPPAEIPQVGPLPALKAGHITFGCLNNFCKVTDPTLEAWTRILQALPESRLILHAHSGSHHDRVRDFLVRQGVAPDRVTFVGFQPTAEYFGQYQEIDVALDPFPYGGGTTTCDALFMGVPVVTLAGDTAVGRGGLSILSNLGLAELVAHDIEQYQRIAVELAQDLLRLSRLRAELRDRMQRSPLMDAPRFARNVEAAYREIWQAWCRRK